MYGLFQNGSRILIGAPGAFYWQGTGQLMSVLNLKKKNCLLDAYFNF